MKAAWSEEQLASAERLLRITEARAAALESTTLVWPQTGEPAERDTVDALVVKGAVRRPGGLLIAADQAATAALSLTAAGLGPVTVAQPAFVYEVSCAPLETLRARHI